MELWNIIKNKALRHPYRIICENQAELTFETLIIWAENFAKNLNGIKCCAILCSSEMATAMALLACFASGVTAVPLSYRYGELHYNRIIEKISPDAIITDEKGKFQIRKISDSSYSEPKHHPALIMCTSGTTGSPKGVMLSEKNIITNVTDISSYFAIDKEDTILISRPLYHCAVLTGEFLTALVKGTNIRFYSDAFNPPEILKLINKHKITTFCGTPTFLSMMVRFKKDSDCACLKYLCISGECMDCETGRRISESFPNAKIYHVYGLSEACPRVSYLAPELFSEYSDCVGKPLKSVSVKILNKDGKEASPGQEGILWVKGDNVMLGYYNDNKKTADTVKKGWLCTGDVAYINEAGLIKIKGRSDDLIIKSGMNIYPAEIEAEVKKDDRVKEVLVYGLQSRFGTQIGIKISGDFSSVEEVKNICKKHLPSYQMPSRIEIFTHLEKTASGKIVRSL